MVLENEQLIEVLLEKYKKAKEHSDLVFLRKIVVVNVQKPLEDANLNFSKEQFNSFVDVVLEDWINEFKE